MHGCPTRGQTKSRKVVKRLLCRVGVADHDQLRLAALIRAPTMFGGAELGAGPLWSCAVQGDGLRLKKEDVGGKRYFDGGNKCTLV